MRPLWNDHLMSDKAERKGLEYDSLNDPSLGRHWGVQLHRQRRGKSVSSSNYVQELLKLGSPQFVECSGTYTTRPILHPEHRPSTSATEESRPADVMEIATAVQQLSEGYMESDRDTESVISSGARSSKVSVDTPPSAFEEGSTCSSTTQKLGLLASWHTSSHLTIQKKERDQTTSRVEVFKTKVNSITKRKDELARKELLAAAAKRKMVEEAERQYLAAIRVGKRELQLSAKEVKEELRQKRLRAERAATELQALLSAEPKPARMPVDRTAEELRALQTRLKHEHKKSRKILERVGDIRRQMSETQRMSLRSASASGTTSVDSRAALKMAVDDGESVVLFGIDDLRFICEKLQRGDLREMSEGLGNSTGTGRTLGGDAASGGGRREADAEKEGALSGGDGESATKSATGSAIQLEGSEDRGSGSSDSTATDTVTVSSPSHSRSTSMLSLGRSRSRDQGLGYGSERHDSLLIDGRSFWHVLTFLGLDTHIEKRTAMRLFSARAVPAVEEESGRGTGEEEWVEGEGLEESIASESSGADPPHITFRHLCQCLVLSGEAAGLAHVGGIPLEYLRVASGEKLLLGPGPPASRAATGRLQVPRRANSTSQQERPRRAGGPGTGREMANRLPPRAQTCPPGMSRPGEPALIGREGSEAGQGAWGGEEMMRRSRVAPGAGTIGQKIKRDVEQKVVQKELWKLLKMSGLLDTDAEQQTRTLAETPTDIETQIPSMEACEPEESQDWAARRLPDLTKSISKAILTDAQTAMAETSFSAPYSWHLRKLCLHRSRQFSELDLNLTPPLVQPGSGASKKRGGIAVRAGSTDSGRGGIGSVMARSGSGGSQNSDTV